MVKINTKLSVLLVEDDPQTCREIIEYIDSLEDIDIADVTNNSEKAASIIRYSLPDAVILDLELHQGSGNGLLLLKALQTNSPAKVPYILVTTNNSSAITYEAARQLGADFILSKHQADYTPQTAVDFLRMMKSVIKGRTPKETSHAEVFESPEAQSKRLARRISVELDRIGISTKASGYQYLIMAIQITMQKHTTKVCDVIGKQYGKTESSVERAMQNAIARAWKSMPIETLLSLYTARISSEKGAPTVTEFIYYYANKLKNEI